MRPAAKLSLVLSVIIIGGASMTWTDSHGQALAQSGVDSRVQKLEETVRALELRVAVLEAQLCERSTPNSVSFVKENWPKLRKGMSESDVRKLLGCPTKVEPFSSLTVWFYGAANVQIDVKSRTVTGWHEL